MPDPIRIYVGGTESETIPARVLEHAIRGNTDADVRLQMLHGAGIEIPMPRRRRNRPATRFSFQRFLIPRLAGYAGRAIYLDSDMQVFGDVAELADWDMAGADVLGVRQPTGSSRPRQLSVALLDCAALAWEIADLIDRMDVGEFSYADLMSAVPIAREVAYTIPPTWNSLEHFEPGETKLLHYTEMDTQPWLSRRNANGSLWMAGLLATLSDGLLTVDTVRRHIEAGWVRPSLRYQIEHEHLDPRTLPEEARRLDDRFVSPHEGLAIRSGLLHRTNRLLRRSAERASRFLGGTKA